MNSKDVIAIVDPYSSGAQLARDVVERGHRCVMVQSGAEIPAMYRSSYHAEGFEAIVRHQGDIDATCDEIQSHSVRHVIAGCEMGVGLTDQLSERLGLVSNTTAQSSARRNKRLMGELLRRRGVRTPDAVASSRWGTIADWLRRRGTWPVVLKPLCSSASDGVRLCANEHEAREAFSDIVGRVDVFGKMNEEVLVQEFITGPEFAVDTVSCAGRHRIAAVWEYGAAEIGDAFLGQGSMELLRPTSPMYEQLFGYVSSVLDALEIQYGPAHCELILSDDGPVIVEVGARPNGGNNPLLSRHAGGDDQLNMTLDAYLNPHAFLEQVEQPIELPRGAIRAFLRPRRIGCLRTPPKFSPIRNLESFHELRFSAKPGQMLSRIAGWVVLVHEDRSVLHRDLDRIRRIEQAGLYEIEDES